MSMHMFADADVRRGMMPRSSALGILGLVLPNLSPSGPAFGTGSPP
jgi:hypothetical protein